jgi:hypothetical protein
MAKKVKNDKLYWYIAVQRIAREVGEPKGTERIEIVSPASNIADPVEFVHVVSDPEILQANVVAAPLLITVRV